METIFTADIKVGLPRRMADKPAHLEALGFHPRVFHFEGYSGGCTPNAFPRTVSGYPTPYGRCYKYVTTGPSGSVVTDTNTGEVFVVVATSTAEGDVDVPSSYWAILLPWEEAGEFAAETAAARASVEAFERLLWLSEVVAEEAEYARMQAVLAAIRERTDTSVPEKPLVSVKTRAVPRV